MAKQCILCCGVGAWYPRGLDRQKDSLTKVGFTGTFLSWRNRWPPNSPTHKQSPYAFKVAAFREAQRQGFELAVWADTSAWFIKHPGPLFERIEQQGYYFLYLGWNTSEWCLDEHLSKLGVTRDEARKMPMVAALMYGLDLRTETSKNLLDWMEARSKDGCFVGPWSIQDGREDNDPLKVRGHRHDQTALSVIVAKLGLHVDRPFANGKTKGILWDYYSDNPADTEVALAQGM